MNLKDIFKDKKTLIFKVVNDDFDVVLDVEPTDLQIIPDENGYFIVRAVEVDGSKTTDCFMDMHTPERISEMIIKKDFLGNVKITDYYESEVVPAMASDCFGIYEMYYSTSNPDIGIQILRNGLTCAKNKQIVAEDLGYILRDEMRLEEAIEAFKKSVEFGPTTPYSYLELSDLYEKLGDLNLKEEYYNKFIEKGGRIINIL